MAFIWFPKNLSWIYRKISLITNPNFNVVPCGFMNDASQGEHDPYDNDNDNGRFL